MSDEKNSWFLRLKKGLTKSADRITEGLTDIVRRKRLDQETLDHLEDLLIKADFGIHTAQKIIQRIKSARFDQDITEQDLKGYLVEDVTKILEPVARTFLPQRDHKPHVVLIVGVNGSGKTTTIGKLAHHFTEQGLKVALAAGDTFRAAAVDQLKVWGERCGCSVYAKETSADPAALAYEALLESKKNNDDLLLIDTAGRLHNKADLMAELGKIARVLSKQDPSAPHDVILVLDATIGQNALQQVEVFKSIAKVTGLVITKLDGTARGGILVALTEKFSLPLYAIGIGETLADLKAFEAEAYAKNLIGFD
jgi:fused signal recognition particle receptor